MWFTHGSFAAAHPRMSRHKGLRWLLLVVINLCQLVNVTRGENFIDSTVYRKFPKLFEYEEFENCRSAYGDQYVYCVVRARITPDDSSYLWGNLSEFSQDSRHYDHRVQESGICVQTCEKLLYGQVFEKDASQGHSYSELLRSCLNQRLQADYGLQIEQDVDIYHCYSKADGDRPYDTLEIIFLAISSLVAVLVCYSTWYDMSLQTRQRFPTNYFAKSHPTSRDRLLTAFSFPRNIRRLKDNYITDTRRDLNFLEGLRTVHMQRVITLHVVMAMAKAPKINPEGLEQLLYKPLVVHYVAEFQNYVQTFFSISGMLLAVNFLEHIKKNPEFNMRYFWERLRARLYRIVPAYFFVVLLEVSINKRFMQGPLAEHFIGQSQEHCRTRWWSNVFFLNNYIGTEQPCLLQSWYLAADLQLFIFALGCLMLIWRWPVLKKYLLFAGFGWGILFTTVIAYLRSLPPVMTKDLKRYEEYNFGHPYFQLYTPFHMNITIYFAGMIAGFVYYRFRETRKEFLKSRLLAILFQISLVLFVLTVATDYPVVRYAAAIPSILLAIYASWYKHAWGLLITLINLKISLLPDRNRVKSFFGHPIFVVLGKLCYSFYLIHMSVIVQVFGAEKQPIYFSMRQVHTYTTAIIAWTVIFGTLLAVLIELPSNVALRELLEDKKEPAEKTVPTIQMAATPTSGGKPVLS